MIEMDMVHNWFSFFIIYLFSIYVFIIIINIIYYFDSISCEYKINTVQ